LNILFFCVKKKIEKTTKVSYYGSPGCVLFEGNMVNLNKLDQDRFSYPPGTLDPNRELPSGEFETPPVEVCPSTSRWEYPMEMSSFEDDPEREW
jgi:hypothetical protein